MDARDEGEDDRFPVFTTSYAIRETPREIWQNRVGVTGTLFAAVMIGSYLLSRTHS